jgi:hypothetical protein
LSAWCACSSSGTGSTLADEHARHCAHWARDAEKSEDHRVELLKEHQAIEQCATFGASCAWPGDSENVTALSSIRGNQMKTGFPTRTRTGRPAAAPAHPAMALPCMQSP